MMISTFIVSWSPFGDSDTWKTWKTATLAAMYAERGRSWIKVPLYVCFAYSKIRNLSLWQLMHLIKNDHPWRVRRWMGCSSVKSQVIVYAEHGLYFEEIAFECCLVSPGMIGEIWFTRHRIENQVVCGKGWPAKRKRDADCYAPSYQRLHSRKSPFDLSPW